MNSDELTKSIIHQNQNSFSNQDDIDNNNSRRLRIIHFNDVYNIESDINEPKGGAARFGTLIKTLKAQEPSLVLFSGDAFAPSTRNLAISVLEFNLVYLKPCSLKLAALLKESIWYQC